MRVRRAAHLWLLPVFLVAAHLGACAPGAPARPSAPSQKHVQFSILEDYDKGEDLAEIARDFDLFRELGVSTWRGSFGWDDYEPARGVYDFEWLHRFAELAAAKGLTLRPYIAYTPEWAAAGGTDTDAWNDPPKNADDWFRFVRALSSAMRRHPNIASYEIYNEENVRQWWDGTPGAYEDVLRRAVDAIDEGDPDAQVILGGMVFPDVEWLEAVCGPGGSGRLVDVIPFHAYPETWTPQDVTVENYLPATFGSEFIAFADRACGRKQVWINETGYATLPGRSEEDQARWWIRAIATFLSHPRIDHIGIYEIRDLRPDRPAIGDAPNYHLGIMRSDGRKKMAFGTIQRLVSLLGTQPIRVTTGRMTIEMSTPANVHHQLFTGADGRQFLFAWARDERVDVTFRLPGGDLRVIEYAIDGARRDDFTAAGGAVHVRLQPGEVRFYEAGNPRSR